MTTIPFHRVAVLVASLILTGGCTIIPTGPSMLVLPGSGKSFDQFRVDDRICRDYALAQIGGKPPGQASIDSGVASAVVGTAIGTAAGAAIGGSRGAGVGAGAGLLLGSAAGVGASEGSFYANQRRYDFGYQQCMYANGHRIPVTGQFTVESPREALPPPPPPPPGAPPPAAGTAAPTPPR
ncbi:MAG: hypothetical protein ACKVQU_00790 [Burkholderiales bacterium]